MAAQLKKLGAAALKAQFVNGHWRKAAVSARAAARLKKEARLEGRDWPWEEEKPQAKRPFGQYKACKGQKHDKLKPEREAAIAKNMAEMPKRIAEYRESRKIKNESLLDIIFSTTKKERVLKQRAAIKT